MAPRPVTLSIADFCARTGVGRERLRTWERRHGFPQPVRTGDGPRRYDVDDVARVIVIQQAVRSGVSLVAAIRAARASTPPAPLRRHPTTSTPRPTTRRSRCSRLPGPNRSRCCGVTARPGLRRVARRGRRAARRGSLDARERRGGPAARTAVGSWFRGPSSSATRTGAATSRAARARSPGEAPAAPARARSPSCSECPRSGGDNGAAVREGGQSWIGAFCSATSSAAATLRDEVGPGAIIGAVEALASGVGAADGALATYAAGNLLAGRSVRGLMAPRVVAVCAFDDLAAALHDGVVDWLGQPAREAFGIDGSQALLMVPVIAAGERLGVLLLSFNGRTPAGRSRAGVAARGGDVDRFRAAAAAGGRPARRTGRREPPPGQRRIRPRPSRSSRACPRSSA